MLNEGDSDIPGNPREQQYERILKAREAGAEALRDNKVVAFEETEKGEGRKEKRHRKHEWMADKQPLKRFIGTHLMREPSSKIPVSFRERVDDYNEGVNKLTESPKRLKKFFGWCLRVGIPVAVTVGAVIFLYGKYIVGGETAASGITAVDQANRKNRYSYYLTDDGVNNTDAEKWAAGEWSGYSSESLLLNLNPAQNYTEPMSFVEYCSPKCFFDSAKFPKADRPVMEEILGLTPEEYQYYSDHLSEWEQVKGGLVEKLREKYPANSDYPWLPDLFNIRPTDFKSKKPSDFENWYNLWHEIDQQTGVFNPNISSARGRIQAVGLTQFRDVFVGRRDIRGAVSKGSGFGTTKGFS